MTPGGEITTEMSSCTGTVLVYQNMGRADEEDLAAAGEDIDEDNACVYVPVAYYNCDTGEYTTVGDWMGDNISYEEIVSACDTSSVSRFHSCEVNRWSGKLECDFWNEKLSVSLNFPGVELHIEPYPVTMIHWPTYFRYVGGGTAGAKDAIPFLGRGTVDHPRPGDQRNIVLSLMLYPYPYLNYLQMYLPQAGYYQGDGKQCAVRGTFFLPPQNPTSRPATVLCWNLPSHPKAGAGPLAGGISGLDEVASDFPLFVGWARAPYSAKWSLTWEEWEVVQRNCVAGPNTAGNYTCETTAGLGYNDGHWENVYGWRRHSKGGVIDPAAVQGLPAHMLADVDKDGRPDAFWNYGVTIKRMNEAWSVNDPVYRRSWNWGGKIYIAVREGQTQSIYYPNP